MSPLRYIVEKLKEQIPCTIGFKAFIYTSFAILWFTLALRG